MCRLWEEATRKAGDHRLERGLEKQRLLCGWFVWGRKAAVFLRWSCLVYFPAMLYVRLVGVNKMRSTAKGGGERGFFFAAEATLRRRLARVRAAINKDAKHRFIFAAEATLRRRLAR